MGSEFYNRSMKSWFDKNSIEMYLKHDDWKSVITKRFIGTLKNKINKYMTSILKNVCIDQLDDIVNKYNTTYRSPIKLKTVIVKSITFIDSSKETNDEDPKFETGDIAGISKYKNVLAKGYVVNWSEEVLWLKKIKTLSCGRCY